MDNTDILIIISEVLSIFEADQEANVQRDAEYYEQMANEELPADLRGTKIFKVMLKEGKLDIRCMLLTSPQQLNFNLNFEE